MNEDGFSYLLLCIRLSVWKSKSSGGITDAARKQRAQKAMEKVVSGLGLINIVFTDASQSSTW